MEKLINILERNKDYFAWGHKDLPGLDPSVVVHTLNLDKVVPPMRQPLRKKSPEQWNAVAIEVDKLVKACFVEEEKYPSCVSNIFMV